MKIINFIGNYDKAEIILYVAKLTKLTQNAKVLIIDTLDMQKNRCTIPAILNDIQYITTFEEIDIAIGFNNQKEIVEYLQLHNHDFNDYDYVFIDMSSEEMCKNFDSENPNVTFAVTSYDRYDILKTVGLVEAFVEAKKEFVGNIKMNRIYVYSLLNTSDEKYINHSFNELEVTWAPKNIYIPLDEGDRSVIIQNQYAEKIKLKELSKTFKEAIMEITSVILPDVSKTQIAKTFKNIERSV